MVSGGVYVPTLPGYWQPPAVVTTLPELPAFDPTPTPPCSGHGITYSGLEERNLDGHCEV